MKLTVELNEYTVQELKSRFGDDQEKWSTFVSLFLHQKTAELANHSGLPSCISCGEEVDDSAGYPGYLSKDGIWYHNNCDGIWGDEDKTE